MAIQLNERDHLIFKLIDEHQVLLEKHISFFISCDQKPVLIRDRLRKLFYLDYLFCERHRDTLPWWTTPTKPLVYTLSPLTRSIIGAAESDLDLNDTEVQRHLLEVANLRMLFLIDQNDGIISDFEWTTLSKRNGGSEHIDAKVSFVRNGMTHKIGIINHPSDDAEVLLNRLESALAEEDVETVWVVSRDEAHQERLQACVTAAIGTASSLNRRICFATHQELYKHGVVKTRWQNVEGRSANIFVESIQEAHEAKSCSFKLRPNIATA
jgi:hypothetical protein